jgi:hypothetical protein
VELRQGVFFEGKFTYREFNSGNKGEETWFELKADCSDRPAGKGCLKAANGASLS